jgi:glucose/mannose-6-phosphate isomerase
MAKTKGVQMGFGGKMILDSWESFAALDPAGMLQEIDRLPDQLKSAWEQGMEMPLPAKEGIQHVVVAGMGGSAIGADLLQAFCVSQGAVPIVVWRDYDLPGYVDKSHTLVICSSHSGNTEEVLSAFHRAVQSGVQLLAVTTGGELGKRAQAAGVPVWQFEHTGQPRAAVGFSFGLLLALVHRLGFISDPAKEMSDAVAAMRSQQDSLRAEVPVVENPAKRLAGQLVGRFTTVIGAEFLAPVARRWRTQISELAKASAQFEELPEVDHNLLAGVREPAKWIPGMMVLFLRGSKMHPRNLLRLELTREALMVEGFNTDVVPAQGESRLAEQWTSLHFGDYTAYYLAMAYGMDPTPVAAIEEFKRRLKGA